MVPKAILKSIAFFLLSIYASLEPTLRVKPVVPIFVEHWRGGGIAILPQFCPIFNIGGMKLEHDLFHVSEDQKKESVFTEN